MICWRVQSPGTPKIGWCFSSHSGGPGLRPAFFLRLDFKFLSREICSRIWVWMVLVALPRPQTNRSSGDQNTSSLHSLSRPRKTSPPAFRFFWPHSSLFRLRDQRVPVVALLLLDYVVTACRGWVGFAACW